MKHNSSILVPYSQLQHASGQIRSALSCFWCGSFRIADVRQSSETERHVQQWQSLQAKVSLQLALAHLHRVDVGVDIERHDILIEIAVAYDA